MPRFSHRLLAVLLAAALAAGCETVVDVPAPDHEPTLVAQSFFAPDSAWSVRVTHTVPYASPETPAYVDDATVEIRDGDRLIATPTRIDAGTYVAVGEGPRPGRRYTLRVAAPGYRPTEGSDALPPAPPVAAFRDTTLQPVGAPSRRLVRRIALTLDDPPGAHFYGLMVVQARWREDRRTGVREPLPPTLFTFASDDPVLADDGLDILDVEPRQHREAFFTDGLFDGGVYTVDLDLAYDAPDPDADVVIHRALAVVVLSVSESFYRYWKTAARQSLANENPFAEPLRVTSNLSAGFGVFAGYQYAVFPLDPPRADRPTPALADLCAPAYPLLFACRAR